MSTPHPDLGDLLRGGLEHDGAVAAADHLERCEDCRRSLVTTALGHSVLTRAARTRDPVTTAPLAERAAAAAAVPPVRPAPDPRRSLRPRRRGGRSTGTVRDRRWAVLAAAAVAAVAVIALGQAWPDSGQDASPATVAARLQPVVGQGTGRVEMLPEPGSVTQMVVSTDNLPQLGGGDYYYVWLLDPSTQKMLPLGQVAPDGSASFELPVTLIDRYSAVDVSLERDDGDPAHSVTSVLRAAYTPLPLA